MSQLLKFKKFILENESSEDEGFVMSQGTLSKLEENFGLTKKGIVSNINAFIPSDKVLVNGVSVEVNAKKIAKLLGELSENRYNISPDWFSRSDSQGSKKSLYFIFNKNKDLKIGSYELEPVLNPKYGTYLSSKSKFLMGSYGSRTERPKEMIIEYNCESDDQFIEIFENGISDIVKELCDVKVIYLKEPREENNIPHDLNFEIKMRIKDLYQKSVVSFFETGDIEAQDISISQTILDIYEDIPSLLSTFRGVPEDIADEVIEKAESESYPSDLIIGLKKMQKLNKILKYN